MKQKNILWSLFAMMMVAVLSAGFVACGSDDDDDDKGTSSSVIGTWSGTDDGDQLTLTFKSGGTGTWRSKYYDSYSGTETEVGTFAYEMEGKSKGVIIVEVYDSYYGNETEVMYFEIEGKKMYLYEHDYGDDLEWVLTKQ